MKTLDKAIFAGFFLAIALIIFGLSSCTSKQYYTVTEVQTVRYNLIDTVSGRRVKGHERTKIYENKLKEVKAETLPVTGF
jgi:hypothetical protein